MSRRAYDGLAVVERRVENKRHAGSRVEARNQLVEPRIRRTAHDLHAGSPILMDHGRNAIAKFWFCRAGKQHVFVTCQMRPDFADESFTLTPTPVTGIAQ